MREHQTKYILILLFTLAMAFLETTIVVYLREIYYPEGFQFPLRPMDYEIGQVEFLREFATLIMITAFAWLVGKNRTEKLAVFLILFAVWDIFYYVYLYLLLGWPQAFTTWDVLFLIPVIWVGPVWAPLLNSFTMLLLAFVLIYKRSKTNYPVMKSSDWLYLTIGAVVIIGVYIEDYISYLLTYLSPGQLLLDYYKPETVRLTQAYIPESFSWIVFLVGVGIHLGVISRIFFSSQISDNKLIKSHQ